ncbi:MAG: TonB-dependent receptor [Xanthomonadaceae bacterium]|jgi:iron complex outermembrane receptor protein|nr:TonB-dependent receptor [Xanthomonadaceae bacterium]
MKPIHRTALASAIALGLAAPAYAAPQGDATELEQIVVTGTRAKDRTVLESAVPIDVITREDLRRAGAVGQELGQVLQNLLPTFNFPRQSNSGGADHVRAGQLRGMSPDQVLVLVNGKRRHTSAIVNLEAKIGKGTNPVDFNSIPLGAIARIEVLRDGAGAQYGSDAIAGVINVILDDAPTGGEVGFTYGAHRTDFEPTDDTLSDGQTRSFDAEIGIPLSERGFLRIGFDYTDRAQTERGGPDGIPFFEQQTPANLALAGRVSYRPGDPAVTAYNGWFNGLFPVGEAFDLYAFGTYNDRESEGAAFFRYPDSSQNFRSVYPQGYRPFTTGDNSDLAATVGARGSGSAWSWDASLGFGRNAFDFGVANSLNASLGPTSPTRFDLGRFVFDQLTANLDATRDIAFGDAGPLLLAVGGELRRETYDTRAGDPASYAAGPLTDRPVGAQAGPGLSPADEAESSRTVVGAYADLSGNLTERLFGGAALRYDRYNDFGDAVTGKLSGRYEIAPGYAIRGALSNNFRAPSLAQNSFNFTVTSFGSGGQLRRVRTLAPTNPIAQALGAQELDAETSRNVSLGFTAQPLDGFDVSLDFFQIEVDDRITLSERIGGDDVSAFIQRQFGVAGIDSVNFFTNLVDTRTRGADLVGSWRTEAGSGALTVTGAFTYAKTTLRDVRANPPQLAGLGFDDTLFGVEERNTLLDAAPRQRAVASATWANDDWTVLGRVTRHGSTTRVFNFGGGFEPAQTYGAKYQLDAEVEYRFANRVSLAIGGSNLTDEYPDLSSDDINYFGNLPYDVLSPIGFNGAYWYARVRYAFD